MRYSDFKLMPEGSNLAPGQITKEPEREQLFLQKIQSQSPFTKVDGSQVVIDPAEYNRMKTAIDAGSFAGTITLKTIDGEVLALGKLAKTGEFGGQARAGDNAEEKRIKYNKGEVTEGYHAVSAFTRLITRPSRPITLSDIQPVIANLENGKTLEVKKEEVSSDIADEFHITISLKPGSWASFKDPKVAEHMAQELDSIIQDANDDTAKYAERYEKNGKFDFIRVIGDGVSGETETKTDIEFENKTEKKFAKYSLKVGTVKQIHQVGGGAVSKSRAITREKRFEILQDYLFNVDGKFPLADISAARSNFMSAETNEEAQLIAYTEAAKQLKDRLAQANPSTEKTFIKTLAGALKYWLVRDDDSILLKQFTKKGTYVLDARKFNDLHTKEDLDLDARLITTKAQPIIEIFDTTSNDILVTIRTYRTSAGYIRNYIEKGELFKALTNVANK